MKLYIRNMVSLRCKMLVKSILDEMNCSYRRIEMGEVEMTDELNKSQKERFDMALKQFGMELVSERRSCLVERIKVVVEELINTYDEENKMNFSVFICRRLNHDYTYLSNLFSESLGITIEKYIINNKIEKVKSILIYEDLNLSQIAYKMNYSSVAHLSNQFKKVTGITPSEFKQQKGRRMDPACRINS